MLNDKYIILRTLRMWKSMRKWNLAWPKNSRKAKNQFDFFKKQRESIFLSSWVFGLQFFSINYKVGLKSWINLLSFKVEDNEIMRREKELQSLVKSPAEAESYKMQVRSYIKLCISRIFCESWCFRYHYFRFLIRGPTWWGRVMHARDAYQFFRVYPGSISCIR